MNLTQDHFFTREFLWLKVAATLYVIGIVISHANLPVGWVWGVAAFFSIAMNFTYPWAAFMGRDFVAKEVAIAIFLIGLAVAGIWFPPLVIASIFLHGCWDLSKHCGGGIPFFGWYVKGCVVVDWLYAAVLSIFFYSM